MTKLARPTVEALERDDFAALLEPVYARGYYRKAAKVLGLDEKLLVDAYSSRVVPKSPLPPAKLRLASGEDLGSGNRIPVAMAIVVALGAIIFCAFLWLVRGTTTQLPQSLPSSINGATQSNAPPAATVPAPPAEASTPAQAAPQPEVPAPGADAAVSDPLDEDQKKLLDRYVAAFEGYDMSALTALLHEDAVMTMPPFDLWLTGAGDITGFMTTLGAACAHSRLVPVEVNGLPGFAQYKPDPENGGYTPWAVQALEISDGRITGFHCFLDTQRWFPLFGLPLRLEAETDEVEQGAQRG